MKVFVFLGLYTPVPASSNTLIHNYLFQDSSKLLLRHVHSLLPKATCSLRSRSRNRSSQSLSPTASIRRSSIGPHSCLSCCPSFWSSKELSVFSPCGVVEE